MAPRNSALLALLVLTTNGGTQETRTFPDEARASRPAPASGDTHEGRGFGVDPDTRPAPGGGGNRHALLIGINAYQDVPSLKTPVPDVLELAQVLKQEYGFADVDHLLNERATNAAICAALERYKALPAEDDLLIYFAGHGMAYNREGYWVPHDGKRDMQSSWVSKETIKQLLGRSPARHIVLISDSCFSGSFMRGPGETPMPDIKPDYFDRMNRLRAREIISSGGLEEVADGGFRGHSLFAFHLLDLLQKNARYLSADVLASVLLLRLKSDKYTPQTPGHGRFDPENDEDGSFVFFRKTGAEEPSRETKEGVPVGWRLPLGFEVEVEKQADGSGSYVYVKRTGNDPSRMVLVLPGTFPYRGDLERKTITTPFLIDEQEVTVKRFRCFVRERQPTDLATWNDPNYRDDLQPVVGVSLRTALEFAAWADKVIPDEVHWQYAAAWGPDPKQTHRAYPWGGGFDDVAPPPCVYPPKVDALPKDRSAWGVLGMGSGVREWCVLPVDDPKFDHGDSHWLRRDFGAIRGATQLFTGRRDLRRLHTDAEREVAPVVDYMARDVGFRCILFLERSDGG